MNKSNIALAITAILVSGIANATDITAASTATVFSTATTAATSDEVLKNANIVLTIAGVASLSTLKVADKLSLELTGGAKFDQTTLGTELAEATFLKDGTDDPTISNCVLNAGKTKVECDVDLVTDIAADVTMTLVDTKYDLTGVTAGTDVKLIAEVSTVDIFGDLAVGHKPANEAAYADVFEITASFIDTGTVAAGSASEAKVAASFFHFNDAGTDVTTEVSTALDFAPSADVNTPTAAAANATGNFLIKLSDLPTGTKKVDIIDPVTSSDNLGAATPATGGGDFFLDGAGNGYATVAASVGETLSLAGIVITVEGDAPVSATKAKVGLDYLAGSADPFVSHTAFEPTVFTVVTRNGTSFTTNGVGPALKIKITDMSGSLTAGTGGISLIAYDAAGTMISGSMTTPDLTSNSMVKITGTDLAAAYPGIKRVDVSVASSDITAAAQKVNADGGINVNTLHINGSGNANGAI